MRVRFSESMAGFYTVAAPAYDTGEMVGQRDWNRLSFQLTIGTDNVGALLADPVHRMRATGTVLCKEFSAVPMPVRDGAFDVFVATENPGRYVMRYRLPFDTEDGPMTLLGYKDVGDDWGVDMWADTTTLYTRLVPGIADHDASADGEHARGILRLDAMMFARQLSTFRGTASGIARFGMFFFGKLWAAYSGSRRKPPL